MAKHVKGTNRRSSGGRSGASDDRGGCAGDREESEDSREETGERALQAPIGCRSYPSIRSQPCLMTLKAVVLGAAGGIGQPLSLLLKTNPAITELSLFDIVNTPGVAADLSHIDTPAVVQGYLPPDDGLAKAVKGADVIVIPAGVPRKPGMSRDDLFKVGHTTIAGAHTHTATIRSTTVPIVAEVLKKHGVFDPKRLFGVTTLDVVRASTFIATVAGSASSAPDYTVPVVGGHSGVTIIPLLSQARPSLPSSQSKSDIEALTKRIQFGGDEVVKAKDGAGSATLSMAYAAAEFTNAVLKGLKGEDVIVPSYVHISADPEGGKALLPNGVEKILPLGQLSDYEAALVKTATPELKDNISKGINFVEHSKL
ncbi:L-malate dehydrogenase [Rhizoctonia solani AG-1 IA]|uniref:Malate dehydrogenase n=1 Tax=Thanatephorus cucumeris (strain AG1-IA) TaxID=983506 RepID=L8WMD6_THACA|nr:L-malate dehydrogenase [Rhizoctonia solani AG-1 IA]